MAKKKGKARKPEGDAVEVEKEAGRTFFKKYSEVLGRERRRRGKESELEMKWKLQRHTFLGMSTAPEVVLEVKGKRAAEDEEVCTCFFPETSCQEPKRKRKRAGDEVEAAEAHLLASDFMSTSLS